MRLLIISTEFPPGPGGIAAHAYQLARWTKRLGWEVYVMSPQNYVSNLEISEFNASQEFDVIRIPSRTGFHLYDAMLRTYVILKSFVKVKPDVLVASGQLSMWSAAFLSVVTNKPLLIVGHGSEFTVRSSLQKKINYWALEKAKVVVAVSHYTAKLFDCTTPVVVIPNGADAERFKPNLDTFALKKRMNIQGERILLTVGRVSLRKAQDIVIRALPDVIKKYPDVHYLVIGLPEIQSELEILANDLEVENNVHFLGVVPAEDLALYYNISDLFILVSRCTNDGEVEGYGIVVIEAGLCGLPSVVSAESGLQEAVKEGEAGIVVPVDNVDATRDAIIKLLSNDELLNALSENALKHARTLTWQSQIRRYHDLLCRIAIE